MKFQGMRQVYKITEWKDGCVYKTKHVGYAWIDIDKHVNALDGHELTSISTKHMVELNYKTTRRVSDDTASYVPCNEKGIDSTIQN